MKKNIIIGVLIVIVMILLGIIISKKLFLEDNKNDCNIINGEERCIVLNEGNIKILMVKGQTVEDYNYYGKFYINDKELFTEDTSVESFKVINNNYVLITLNDMDNTTYLFDDTGKTPFSFDKYEKIGKIPYYEFNNNKLTIKLSAEMPIGKLCEKFKKDEYVYIELESSLNNGKFTEPQIIKEITTDEKAKQETGISCIEIKESTNYNDYLEGRY